MIYFVITILLFVLAIFVWLVFVLINAWQKIKLGKEKPASHRLEKAIKYLQKHDKITNEEYRALNRVSDTTAIRDLDELEKLGLVKQMGKTGRSVYYVLTNNSKT